MTIREVEARDREEWLRLRLAIWPEDSAAAHLEQMDDVDGDETQIALVIERPDGRLGGFVEASTHPRALGCETHDVAYVEGWYVDDDLRRQGLGSRLMRETEEWARRRGAREIASDTQIENDISLQGHLRLGYKDVGRLIHFAKKL